MGTALAIDIGGTKFEVGIIDEQGRIHLRRRIATPVGADAEMLFPEKKIWIKPIMLIQMIATVIVGPDARWGGRGAARAVTGARRHRTHARPTPVAPGRAPA